MPKGDWSGYENGRVERGLPSRSFWYSREKDRSGLPKSEAQLNDFVWGRGGSSPVTAELFNRKLVDFDDTGKVVVDRERVRSEAARLVKETNTTTFEDYESDIEFIKADGRLSERDARKTYDRGYAVRAQSIITASEIGGIRLTDVQREKLGSIRENKMSGLYVQSRKMREWSASGDRSGAAYDDFIAMRRESSMNAGAWISAQREGTFDFDRSYRELEHALAAGG